MKKFRAFSLIMAAGLSLLMIAGCWIPENFETNVKVNRDGSYNFTYKGILTYVSVFVAAERKELTKKDEADFKEEFTKEISQDPNFKKIEYLSKGRFQVSVEKLGKPGEQYHFLSEEMNFFSVEPQQDGSIRISTPELSKDDIDDLKSKGIWIDGDLTVSVDKGVKVIEHNAHSEPKLFGILGGYKWKIKSTDVVPESIITVQPSSS